MTASPTIWTCDRVPVGLRGHVRDNRLGVPKLRAALGPFAALQSHLDRILDRRAFRKACQDQMDHFTAADVARSDAARAEG